LKAGEVVITATAQDGSGVKAECRVMVKSPKATEVVLNETQHTATVDDVFTLTANVMPEKAAQKVTWSIDKNEILRDLGEGKFKALKAGEVVITATAQDGSGVKTECRVTVKEKKPEIPKATQVTLNMKLAFIHVEDVLKLTASVFPEKANQKVSWQLSNSMVLESLGEGNFKAVREGEVTITATVQDGSGLKAECKVKVYPPTSLAQITTDGHHTLHWEGNTLVLRGIKPDTSVRLSSLQGKTIQKMLATDTELRIPFGFLQGVFILDTSDGFRVKVIR